MQPVEKLRSLRIERGWKLRDVALALGITEATVSRVERGLQQPSPQLMQAWQTILSGKRWVPTLSQKAQRRPRGVVPRLAELYLADVKAGLVEDAGWRDMEEVGLDLRDAQAIGSDVEIDREHGRVRISKNAHYDQVEQANQIIAYRKALLVEQETLAPEIEDKLPTLWVAINKERTRGPILLVGLSSMIRFTAHLLNPYRNSIPNDPSHLSLGSTGTASFILETMGIKSTSPATLLREAGLEEIIGPDEQSAEVNAAKSLAEAIALSNVVAKVGERIITVLGAAWATSRFLEVKNVSVLTEEGQQKLATQFWNGIGFPRADIYSAWTDFTLRDDLIELERISCLLLSWPEVL